MSASPTLDELRRCALTGDARAQYRLAAALAGAGRREEADQWLARSAESGDSEAYYTLATRLLQTKDGLAEARRLLEKSVSGGSSAAMRALAVLNADGFGATPDWRAALDLVLRAARGGDAAALRDIAGLFFLQDIDDADGAALLIAAASRDPVAGALFVRRATLGRPGADVRAAAPLVERLAAVSYPRAQWLREKLNGTMAGGPPGAPPAPDWTRIEAKAAGIGAALARISEPTNPARERPSEGGIKREALCAAPHVFAVREVVPPEILEYVMALAARSLGPSMTFDPVTGVPRWDDYRTSMTATLGPVDQDLTLVAFNHLTAKIAGHNHAHAEFTSVLRYAPGEEYRPHSDWIPPTGRDFETCGQRIMTALVYLNDDYEGGETHFLAPDLKFKGAPGDILVFANVTADGAPDKVSRHAGLPIRSGAKWIASKWFREREYAY